MIPRIIHYCWYGHSVMPIEMQKCIESWREKCHGYIIKEWNEDNSPMDIPWIKDAYACGKYAFVADYMRFYVLYHYGGIYLDTDMLLIKPIDDLLQDEAFLGREDISRASMGIIGTIQGYQFCKECLDFYDSRRFDEKNLPVITVVLTPLLEKLGLKFANITQKLVNGLVVYERSYFYPVGYSDTFSISELLHPPFGYFIKKGHPTYGIHLWYKSWGDNNDDEFYLFHRKRNKEAFLLVAKHIKENPKQSFKYYKRLAKCLLKIMHLI